MIILLCRRLRASVHKLYHFDILGVDHEGFSSVDRFPFVRKPLWAVDDEQSLVLTAWPMVRPSVEPLSGSQVQDHVAIEVAGKHAVPVGWIGGFPCEVSP